MSIKSNKKKRFIDKNYRLAATATYMLKFVPEYVRQTADSNELKIPNHQIDQNGIVAIIDISGNI